MKNSVVKAKRIIIKIENAFTHRMHNNGKHKLPLFSERAPGPGDRATHKEQCAVEKSGRRARGKMFEWKKLKVL